MATDITKFPEFKIQKEIIRLMVENNCSFKKVSDTVRYKPFANSLRTVPNPPLVYDNNTFPPLNQNNSISYSYRESKKKNE